MESRSNEWKSTKSRRVGDQPKKKAGKASWWEKEKRKAHGFTKDGALRVLARAAQMTMQDNAGGVRLDLIKATLSSNLAAN